MGRKPRQESRRQTSSTTPYTIARINQNLMEGRISGEEAQERIDARRDVWGGTVGQFKDRLIFVERKFVAGQVSGERRYGIGLLGGLSIVDDVEIAHIINDRTSGIRYVGSAVVASIFDRERKHETAQVAVSLPREFSVDRTAERAVFHDYILLSQF